jgi:hypothetical protein
MLKEKLIGGWDMTGIQDIQSRAPVRENISGPGEFELAIDAFGYLRDAAGAVRRYLEQQSDRVQFLNRCGGNVPAAASIISSRVNNILDTSKTPADIAEQFHALFLNYRQSDCTKENNQNAKVDNTQAVINQVIANLGSFYDRFVNDYNSCVSLRDRGSACTVNNGETGGGQDINRITQDGVAGVVRRQAILNELYKLSSNYSNAEQYLKPINETNFPGLSNFITN